MPSNHGVGTQGPTYTLVVYTTASGLVHPQPKPGPQFTVVPSLHVHVSQVTNLLFPLGLGGVQSGELFSPVITSGTCTCDLKIHSQVL